MNAREKADSRVRTAAGLPDSGMAAPATEIESPLVLYNPRVVSHNIPSTIRAGSFERSRNSVCEKFYDASGEDIVEFSFLSLPGPGLWPSVHVLRQRHQALCPRLDTFALGVFQRGSGSSVCGSLAKGSNTRPQAQVFLITASASMASPLAMLKTLYMKNK